MGAPFYYLVAEKNRRLINPTTVKQILELGRSCGLDGSGFPLSSRSPVQY